MPFTPHGLTKVIFHLHCMEITELLHITFRFHRTDYRNCSVYTARNTIVPFTPHGLTKVNFHLHRMETTKLLHITFRFHRTDYRNCSVYIARNTIVPFTPLGLAKVIFLFTPHGNNKNFSLSMHGLPKFTSAYSQRGLTKLFRFHCTD